jgi:hypothetical protein
LNLGFDIRETTPNPFFEEKNMVFKKKTEKKNFWHHPYFFSRLNFPRVFIVPQDSQEELSAKSQQQDQQCFNPQQVKTRLKPFQQPALQA